jgi:hypothetical protein
VADDFADAAKRLRAAERQLMPEVRLGLEEAARELVADAQLSARTSLPRRGGYAQQVANSEFKVAFVQTGRGWKVVITAIGPDYRLDREGRLRHPVHARGPRQDWNWSHEAQRVKSGWFTRPMKAGRPAVRAQLAAAVSRCTRSR